jgi:RNA polymerase sigma-70 factor (ECF subfamily)
MHFLDNRSEVEDLVQDFFVKLWIKSPKLQINLSLKTYLFVSVKNHCFDLLKHKKVVGKYRNNLYYSKSEINHDEPDEYLAESELRQIIQRSLEKLQPRTREIFELSRFKGLTNFEISEKLGLSKRTIELQISNALKVLRHELAAYLPLWLIVWIIG